MTNPKAHPDSRAKVIIGIAMAMIAVYWIKIVVKQDLGNHSTMAAFAAKGIVCALGTMFCLFLYSSSGRIFRKIVGVFSLMLASLLFLGVLFGAFAWLVEGAPVTGIFGGHKPAAVAAGFVANAYIAWAFCFSPAVRAYEKRASQAVQATPGLRSSVSDL